jgi:hypothetical protein
MKQSSRIVFFRLRAGKQSSGGKLQRLPPTSYSAAVSDAVLYWVNAQGFVPMSATSNPGATGCIPPSLPAAFDSTTQLTVTPGTTTTQSFNFTGCQQ